MKLMKEIPLTKGKIAIVDDEDFEWLSQYKWQAMQDKKYTWYARHTTYKPRKITLMHTEIMGQLGVDHINRNGLDNRRANLRLATASQNGINRKRPTHNTSGAVGVSWSKRNSKWKADIRLNGRTFHLGLFSDKTTAAHARRQAELAYFGEFAP